VERGGGGQGELGFGEGEWEDGKIGAWGVGRLWDDGRGINEKRKRKAIGLTFVKGKGRVRARRKTGGGLDGEFIVLLIR
jgi:hypothetical protein